MFNVALPKLHTKIHSPSTTPCPNLPTVPLCFTNSRHQRYEHKYNTTMSTMTLPVAPQLAETEHQLSCPNCGSGVSLDSSRLAHDAQRQIEDLQAQVRLLTQKATAAGSLRSSIPSPNCFAIAVNVLTLLQWTDGRTMKTNSKQCASNVRHKK